MSALGACTSDSWRTSTDINFLTFATQDYLGFDFEPEVIEAAINGTREFGTVVAWCRMVATVEVFNEAEREIAKLIGTEACSIFASTTLF